MSTAVTIVVCTRNRAAQLQRCLQAVDEIRAQRSWDLVVVNNGSTDSTEQLLAAHRPRRCRRFVTVYEARPGLGRARNAGWRRADTQLVAFTDDDCYPGEDFVDKVAECFEEDRGLGFCGGRILLFDPSDCRITIQELDRHVDIAPRSFIQAGLIQGANFTLRKDLLEEVGGFDDALGAGTPFPCEDVELLARASAAGWRGAYDPRPMVYHHHGRKSHSDMYRLSRSYDYGRGAYYAKCLLHPRLRALYFLKWMRCAATQSPFTTVREIRGAGRYWLRSSA